MPEFVTPFGRINSDMLWVFIGFFLALFLILTRRKVIYSTTFILMLLYYGYLFVNASLKGYGDRIIKTEVALYLSSLFVYFLIDNTTFDWNDTKRIKKLLILLIIIAFIGSLLQYFVDNSLFVNLQTYQDISEIDFGEFWRNGSIFDSLMQNQGGIMFIFLLLGYLYDIENLNKKYAYIPLIMLLTSGILTFTRYVMLTQIIIVLVYFWAQYSISYKKLLHLSIMLGTLILIVIVNYEKIIQTNFVQDRILADISGRSTDPMDFFINYSTNHNFLFGTGVSSYMFEYFYGDIRRLHSGVADLFFFGGIFGLIIFLSILWQFHRLAWRGYTRQGHVILLLTGPIILLINLTACLNYFYFLGYIFIYLILSIESRRDKKKEF